jgi:hypothetical protein
MTIEKIDFTILQEKKSFTTHFNSVLQNLTNAGALGLWCYLSSLPIDWIINKQHLMNHFDIGKDKLKSYLDHLVKNNLIEIGQERLENGTMGKSYIKVKCGYDFVKDMANSPDAGNQKPANSPDAGLPATAEPATANPPLQKKDIKKIKDKAEKREVKLAATASPPPSLSDFFPDEKAKAYCVRFELDFDFELSMFKMYAEEEKWPAKSLAFKFKAWLIRSAKYKHNQKRA